MSVCRRCISPFLVIVAAALAVPGLAHADGIQPGYVDFQALKEKYDKEKKVQLQEGYVLETLNDKSGRKTGTLSFGGETRVGDPYQGLGARTNFGNRDLNEIDGPKINLRIAF